MGAERDRPQAGARHRWLFFDHAVEGMVVTRVEDGVIVAANDAWLGLTRHAREDVVGRTWADLALHEDPEPRASLRAGSGDRVERREVRLRTRLGEFRIVDERSQLIEMDGVGFVLTTAIDLSEERELLVELERGRADLATAQSISRTGSFAFDVRTNEVLPSDELLRLFSIDPSEFAGTLEEVLGRLHPEDVPHVMETIRIVLEERRVPSVRVRAMGPQGEVRWLDARGGLEVDPDGTPLRVVGTAQDVTELVRLEQEGKRMLARLVELRESDRREVAEELHEGLLQTLSALLLRLELTASRVAEPYATDLTRVSGAVRGSMRSLRRLMFDLRPTALDHGVGPAVEELAARMLAAWDLQVQVVDAIGEPVSEEASALVYRFLREALAALAPGSADIRLEVEERVLLVEVRHRGRGRLHDADRPLLQEAAQLAGGTLEIESNDETVLRLRLADPSSLSV